jgi:hypothetical protein
MSVHPTVFSHVEIKICVKDLAKKFFGRSRYHVRGVAFMSEEKPDLKHRRDIK